MINREELKKKIPHGGSKEIARRANVSTVTVSKYFSNQIDSEAVEMATLEYLAEISQKQKETNKRKEELLSKIL